MAKLGVVNLTLLTTALGQAATVGGLIFEDGDVTIGDVRHLRGVLVALKKLKAVSYLELLPESKDLDDAEREELSALFAQVFVLPSSLKTHEEIVEAGIGYLLLAIQAIGIFLPGGTAVPFRRTVAA